MHYILFMVGDTVFAFNPSTLLYETPTHIWKLLKISISVFEVTFYAIQSFLRKHCLPVVFLMTVIYFLFTFPSIGKSLVIDNVLYDLLKLFVYISLTVLRSAHFIFVSIKRTQTRTKCTILGLQNHEECVNHYNKKKLSKLLTPIRVVVSLHSHLKKTRYILYHCIKGGVDICWSIMLSPVMFIYI